MQLEEAEIYLKERVNELAEIRSRFTRTQRSIDIQPSDETLFMQRVREIVDFLRDELVEGAGYSSEVVMLLNDGLSNSLGTPSAHSVEAIRGVLAAILTRIRRNPAALKDREGSAARALRAYNGLALHPEIERAASTLYRDGHYANAVEAAVKALNGLVRLRSDLEFDGATLMERAFSPSNPVLKFNDLQNQSDKEEQKGFMQMFSGAVSGLRNPRAHSFIHDQPERALEFIAFVSLLAKLLDGARRTQDAGAADPV